MDFSIEALISRKRKRVERQESHAQLHNLFDKLNEDIELNEQDDADLQPEKEESKEEAEKVPDEELLFSDSSANENEEDAHQLVSVASNFLDEEQSSKLKEVLTKSTEKRKKERRYQFFKHRTKLPCPRLSKDMCQAVSPCSQGKVDFVLSLADSAEGRRFLLSNGTLRYWYRRGWTCPHYIYQWLMEIVALERDAMTAKHAYDTLLSLWSNLGRQCSPLQKGTKIKLKDGNQHITLSTFVYILASYGAIPLELSSNEGMVTDVHIDVNSICETVVQATVDVTVEERIPLTQFAWVLQLMGISVKSWHFLYDGMSIKYLLQLLFQISLDRVAPYLMREIETAVACCLSILSEAKWQQKIRKYALDTRLRFPSLEHQVQLFRTMKPTCERTLYFQRILALTSLSFYHNHEDEELTRNEILELQSSHDIISFIIRLLTDQGSIFQQRKPDFVMLQHLTLILDVAVSNNDTELKKDKDRIQDIIVELQKIGRKLGGRVGVLERTVANEAIQRLWNRLAYVIGRDGMSIEEHQV
ncbi:uncharacterized protein BYT42DRAFT_587956 [Radiomyces spectabilis]|uniref:uncharacterized protein n=1 Tax=Radiomyces spectabilis TaxID=64574 RepID=UPI00221FEB46|nr:uncharacterized protein BYT42DRAFT_587956 [Radiomyces spectabilis]KAI8366816.1 hypothetical protein BYT42DRAFT_587956 [Radiomyces spectabilis]